MALKLYTFGVKDISEYEAYAERCFSSTLTGFEKVNCIDQTHA